MSETGPLFFGYDLGSHGAKGALFGLDGRMVASASRSHAISRPAPGWQEQDPLGLWWAEFRDIARELTGGGRTVAGIAVTGFVPGLCALDAQGTPVRPAIMHTDIRASVELEELNRQLPRPVTLGTLLPKLLWIRNHEPELFARIASVVVPHAYIVYRLTGRIVCDYDTASIYGGLFDSGRLAWDEELCAALELDPSLFPEPVPLTRAVGTVLPETARELGLSPGAGVIAGTGDSFAALAGEGAVHPGDLMIYLGTSATRILVEAPLGSIAEKPHFGGGGASFAGRIFSCGESMEHYRALLGKQGWKELDEAAAAVPAGSGGVLLFPHMKQRGDGERGMLDRESIIGFESSHGQGHLFRALLEGIAFQLRADLEGMAARVRRVLLAGGGAKSGVFCSIIASVLGRSVLTTPGSGGPAGMALLAAWSLGYAGNLEELADSWFSLRDEHLPDARDAAVYTGIFGRYQEIRKKTEEAHRLIDLG